MHRSLSFQFSKVIFNKINYPNMYVYSNENEQ